MILKNCMYRTLLATVALAFSSVTASAETITVCASGCDYTSINTAISAASDGDVIQLAAETYFEGEVIDTLGKAIRLRGVLDKAGEPASVLDGAGAHRVLICQSGETSTTVFENLVIQNGSGSFGGGMLNTASSNPTLTNCTFTNNSADYYGGGMRNTASSNPTLTSCIFCGNFPDQIQGDWRNMGGNCLSFSCEDQNGNGLPDTCDRGSSRTLHVPSEYSTVQSAVDAAGYGDVVLIEVGLYCPNDTINPQGKPITIRGAVNRFGDPATILDGGNAIRVLTCRTGEVASTVFENLVIQNGSAISQYGGGMYNSFSSPTLTNCVFKSNSADDGGGGMANFASSPTLANCMFEGNLGNSEKGGAMSNLSSSSPTLTNCVFTSNLAYRGGGIYNESGSPTLVKCMFTNNSAKSGASAGWGGGMYNDIASSPTLTDCTFTGNSASDGGGMYNLYSGPTLANCTFTSNSASNGGGMMSSIGAPALTGCTFANNSAFRGGGMLDVSKPYESPILIDCTFTGNEADGDGGGMVFGNGTFVSCTFTKNSASRGGGMASNPFTSPELISCTFTANSATGNGGGMYNLNNSSPALTDCKLCSNDSGQIYGGYKDLGGNCVSDSCDDCDLPPGLCPTDLDQNGTTDGGDLGAFFVYWGDCQVKDCPADFNDDGMVDGIDLGILFSAWGPCQ